MGARMDDNAVALADDLEALLRRHAIDRGTSVECFVRVLLGVAASYCQRVGMGEADFGVTARDIYRPVAAIRSTMPPGGEA